jgi:hypothetical protein
MPFAVVGAVVGAIGAANTVAGWLCCGPSQPTGGQKSSSSPSGSSSGSQAAAAPMSGLTAQFAPKAASSASLVGQPTFNDTSVSDIPMAAPMMSAPAAVNAKTGGAIGHYDVGGGIPEVSTQPQFAHGHPQLTAGFSRNIPRPQMGNVAFQAHKAGGEISGHNPEFFSEGGLNHTFVQGAGDGTSDSVPAMLANGEFVIPADVVSSLGNGDNKSGAKVMDQFLKTIREHKRNVASNKLPPDSKGPLGYLQEAHKKAK